MFVHSLPYPSWACLFSVFFHTVATFCVMSLVRCSCPQSKQHCLRQLPSHNRHPSVLLCYLNNRYWSWILEKYWENLYTDHFFKHMAPDKFDVTTSQTDCETKHENDRNSLIGSVNTNLEISSDFVLSLNMSGHFPSKTPIWPSTDCSALTLWPTILPY